MDKVFRKIAEEENALYSNQSEKYNKVLGSLRPDNLYHLEIPYKGATIYLTNVVEFLAIGEVYVHLPKKPKDQEFEINTRSHIIQLLVPNKNQIRIKTKFKKLKSLLKNSMAYFRMQKLIDKTQFEPLIYGKNKDGVFIIKTEYNLAFKRRDEVLRPIIQFYKELIDLYSEN